MSNKDTVFYRGRTATIIDFQQMRLVLRAALLLEKLERKHRILDFMYNGQKGG